MFYDQTGKTGCGKSKITASKLQVQNRFKYKVLSRGVTGTRKVGWVRAGMGTRNPPEIEDTRYIHVFDVHLSNESTRNVVRLNRKGEIQYCGI